MSSLSAGTIFDDRYEVRAVLGEGGSATVYLAHDRHVRCDVALKVLKAGWEENGGRARFERELRIISSLKGPHTVAFLGHGVRDGVSYLVFEYIDGEDLAVRLERLGRLDVREVVDMTRQVLTSLAEAHNAGLIHRDIKPENLRISTGPDGRPFVKVLDFGIARAQRPGAQSITRTGELVGTPRYMSPEQLTDRPLTAASDIYSVGMVAFEALLGGDALHGRALGAQLERLRSGYLFGVSGEGAIDPRLLEVLQRMTARLPEDRCGSATAAIAALDALQSGGPQRPATLPGDARPTGLVVGLGVVVLVVLAAGYVAWSNQADDPTGEVRPPPRIPNALIKQASADAALHPTPDVGAVSVAPDLGPDLTEARYVVPEDASPSPGCHAVDMVDAGWFQLGSTSIYLPQDDRTSVARPLMVLLHDSFQAPATFANETFIALADREGFVIAAPNGSTLPGHARAWRSRAGKRVPLTALRERLRADVCFDERRVYLVGNGDGARQAAAGAPWVTAMALNGTGVAPIQQSWFDGAAIPTIWLHAMNSPSAPADGSPNCHGHKRLAVDQVEEMWRGRNRCTTKRRRTVHGESFCETWTCDVPLEFCRLQGGRSWPGAASLARTCGAQEEAPRFPVTETVWQFLKASEPLTTVPE